MRREHSSTLKQFDVPMPLDEEISLIDIWLVLLRRKRIVIGLTLMGLVAGVWMAMSQEPVYKYATTAEIGGWWEGIGAERRFSPVSSSPLLERSITAVVAAARESVEVVPRISKNGLRMTLTSEGTLAQAKRIEAVHQEIIVRMAELHGDLLTAIKAEVGAKLARTKMRRARLDREIRLRGELASVFEETSLRLAAAKSANRADTPLLDVSERLFRAQEGLRHSQNQREGLIAETRGLKQALHTMTPSRQLGETVSSGPRGPSASVLAALAAVLGLFAGILGAFLAEFLIKVREAQAQAYLSHLYP